MGKSFGLWLAVIICLCLVPGGCKKTDGDEFQITRADVEYISKTIISMLHSAQQDAIADAVGRLPAGSPGGPIDWTPGGNFNGIHIQGSVLGHSDYSADAETTVHLGSVDLAPFDSRGLDLEIPQGEGTIITHIDQGWLQETFNFNLTLRLKAVNYDMTFANAILYFDLVTMRLTAEVVFDHTSYNLNISFIPSV